MNHRLFAGAAITAVGVVLLAGAAFAQRGGGAERAPTTDYAVTSGPAKNGTPAWYVLGSYPDPGGRTEVEGGKVTIPPAAPRGGGAGAGAGAGRAAGPAPASVDVRPPGCTKSPICGNPIGPQRGDMKRIAYAQTLGYTYAYPFEMPKGTGGIPSVALDSKNNLWAFKRTPDGVPKLYEFSPSGKLLQSIPESVTGTVAKAHGMAIDADDNIWILDTGYATAKKISPDGKLLQTIGVRGHRGDWDEAKGQRLLWEPVMIAFDKTGDIYIAEGHGNESPNDTNSGDPTNTLGNSRIIRLDKAGNFKAQYFGNNVGPGKFYSAHGFAIDPKTGDMWIGDREDYRIIVLNNQGKLVKTISTTNLVCAIEFDPQGNPWYASGQDGQYLKIDRDGKVVGAVGKGMGIGEGQFIEASYMVFDKQMNIYAGDTSVGRITKMVKGGKK